MEFTIASGNVRAFWVPLWVLEQSFDFRTESYHTVLGDYSRLRPPMNLPNAQHNSNSYTFVVALPGLASTTGRTARYINGQDAVSRCPRAPSRYATTREPCPPKPSERPKTNILPNLPLTRTHSMHLASFTTHGKTVRTVAQHPADDLLNTRCGIFRTPWWGGFQYRTPTHVALHRTDHPRTVGLGGIPSAKHAGGLWWLAQVQRPKLRKCQAESRHRRGLVPILTSST